MSTNELARRSISVVAFVGNSDFGMHGLVVRPGWVLAPAMPAPNMHYHINGNHADAVANDPRLGLVLLRVKGVGIGIPVLAIPAGDDPSNVGEMVWCFSKGDGLEQNKGKIISSPGLYFTIEIPGSDRVTGELVYSMAGGSPVFRGMVIGAEAENINRLPNGQPQIRLTGTARAVSIRTIAFFLREAETNQVLLASYPDLKLVQQ